MKYIVIHYSEIGTKGKNREYFERKLVENIKGKIKAAGVIKDYGQFILEVEDFDDKSRSELMNTPGISHYIIADIADNNIEKIGEKTLEILKTKEFSSFRIRAYRHNKRFPLNSLQINQKVGEIVANKLEKKVMLKGADINIYIEICNKNAFIGVERISGLGGLPIGSAGKVVSLISGGIDSPVAAYMMMKRGCEIVFVHFQNETIAKCGVKEKIWKLCEKLGNYQSKIKLYIVPFGELQREIIASCPSELRMLIYRYFMLKTADEIAYKEGALALATGDNLAQVASQTLENLNALYPFASRIVLSPLIGFSKEDIISIAKEIGTYEISILPYGDCCSFFIAEHPELRASKEMIAGIVGRLNSAEMIDKIIGKAEIVEIGRDKFKQ